MLSIYLDLSLLKLSESSSAFARCGRLISSTITFDIREECSVALGLSLWKEK